MGTDVGVVRRAPNRSWLPPLQREAARQTQQFIDGSRIEAETMDRSHSAQTTLRRMTVR
jgi:hypothetical protein